ncbi:Kunitz/Bovine pancreatic trypsin inhibitor domain protein [Ancylostoma ceylanicum]|uniref:Kunitz/Bovine pancreatic trypsin inhibitor domain protein n=1 Tax=Ancylostoma ceylanicum TaxID=53326 RepID=A0A0D6LA13_9BILA|nr:Kunitz/Bovine pancreatic trypsin inhibitor domain protein [Ancylostoma ceylanicum]
MFALITPGVCQPMMHRGCGGNENKFDSAAKCKEQCIEKKGKAKPSAPASKGAGLVDYICSLPASSGSETRTQKHYGRYVYQRGLSNCIRFSYFGTGELQISYQTLFTAKYKLYDDQKRNNKP